MPLLTPKQRAWAIFVCEIIIWAVTAGGVAVTSGAKAWGVAAAVALSLATNILHGLSASPNDDIKSPLDVQARHDEMLEQPGNKTKT